MGRCCPLPASPLPLFTTLPCHPRMHKVGVWTKTKGALRWHILRSHQLRQIPSSCTRIRITGSSSPDVGQHTLAALSNLVRCSLGFSARAVLLYLMLSQVLDVTPDTYVHNERISSRILYFARGKLFTFL